MSVYTLISNANGSFTAREQNTPWGAGVLDRVAIADLDGSKRADLVFPFRDVNWCPDTIFKTTGRYHGCVCPEGQHKSYYANFKYQASCEDGLSGKKRCEQDLTKSWYGIDSDNGVCVKWANFTAIHRQAYYEYFTNVTLTEVELGESELTVPDTAMTDCLRIYFPTSAHIFANIDNEVAFTDDLWLLHEITHTDQCMSMSATESGTKRDKYADMWFSQLGRQILIDMLTGQFTDTKTLHDSMPMEQHADAKAQAVLNAVGD